MLISQIFLFALKYSVKELEWALFKVFNDFERNFLSNLSAYCQKSIADHHIDHESLFINSFRYSLLSVTTVIWNAQKATSVQVVAMMQ